jgi:phosphatidate phosphatase APP1
VTAPRPHLAARAEDRVLAVLGRMLRRLGWLPRLEAYTGLGTPRRVRVLGRVLLSPRRLGRGAPEPVQRGFRSFLTVPAPGEAVEITVGGTVVDVVTDRNGYIDLEIDLPDDAPLPPGWQRATLHTSGAERPAGPEVGAALLVVDDDVRLGVVSDIDDTAMVSAVPRLLVAAWNLLWVRTAARVAVRGMPELYRRIAAAHPDAPFVYLSAGAWNTARSLRRFLGRYRYPAGPLLLTDFGPTGTGWFRSGWQHKTTSLERLFTTFPQVRWVLVGDNGQRDPAVYSDAAQRHPENVAAIAIRTLTPTERVLATGAAAADGRTDGVPSGDAPAAEHAAPAPVVHGADGDELAAALAQVPGLFAPRADAGSP